MEMNRTLGRVISTVGSSFFAQLIISSVNTINKFAFRNQEINDAILGVFIDCGLQIVTINPLEFIIDDKVIEKLLCI